MSIQPNRRRRRIHPESLGVIGRAWASAANGNVQGPLGSIVLVGGEPRDLHSLEMLNLAMEEPGVIFREGEVIGRPPTPRLAAALWSAAVLAARPKRLGPKTLLVAQADPSRFAAFELSKSTRDLLACMNDNGHLPLGGLIRMDKSHRAEVLHELACLVAMGLFEAHKLARPQQARAPVMRSSHMVEEIYGRREAPTPVVERPSDPVLVRRLERELSRIAGLDDTTLLGLPPKLSEQETDRHLERVVNRYGRLVHAHDTGEPARSLARKVHGKMLDAAERVRSGKARRAKVEVNPSTALQDGKAQIERGDFETAAKFFAVARKHEPYNAANIAWLGWAIYNDPSRDAVSRRQRGRKLLDESEGLGGANGDSGFLQARADILEGDLVRAWTRLEDVVRAWPKHAAASRLLEQVQKDVKKA